MKKIILIVCLLICLSSCISDGGKIPLSSTGQPDICSCHTETSPGWTK